MTGTLQIVELGGRKALLYLPPHYQQTDSRYPVAFINDGESFGRHAKEVLRTLEEEMEQGLCRPFLLAALYSDRRDDEYTPWPALDLPEELGTFGGGGDAYLQELVQVCKPALDQGWRTTPGPADTALVGLSLGGLISLYALYRTEAFGKAVSISGSCWYPGWRAFLSAHTPCGPHARVLLTCGRYEGRSRFSLGEDAAACTEGTAALLRAQLGEDAVSLRMDNGKHHDKQVSRYRYALHWLFATDPDDA